MSVQKCAGRRAGIALAEGPGVGVASSVLSDQASSLGGDMSFTGVDPSKIGHVYDYRWYNRSSAAEDCPAGYVEGCDRFLKGVGRAVGGELRAQIQWPILRASTLVGVDGKVRDVFDNQTIEGPLGERIRAGLRSFGASPWPTPRCQIPPS